MISWKSIPHKTTGVITTFLKPYQSQSVVDAFVVEFLSIFIFDKDGGTIQMSMGIMCNHFPDWFKMDDR